MLTCAFRCILIYSPVSSDVSYIIERLDSKVAIGDAVRQLRVSHGINIGRSHWKYKYIKSFNKQEN